MWLVALKHAYEALYMAKRVGNVYSAFITGRKTIREAEAGVIICTRISSLSFCQLDCWQGVKLLGKVPFSGLQQAPLVLSWLEVVRLRARSFSGRPSVAVTISRYADLIGSSERNTENSKGMLPACGIPFCLPKA